jgi:hypothetical protein
MATNAEILARLKEKYYDALESQKPSYKIGENSVSYTEYLSGLAKQIEFFESLEDEITIETTYGV